MSEIRPLNREGGRGRVVDQARLGETNGPNKKPLSSYKVVFFLAALGAGLSGLGSVIDFFTRFVGEESQDRQAETLPVSSDNRPGAQSSRPITPEREIPDQVPAPTKPRKKDSLTLPDKVINSKATRTGGEGADGTPAYDIVLTLNQPIPPGYEYVEVFIHTNKDWPERGAQLTPGETTITLRGVFCHHSLDGEGEYLKLVLGGEGQQELVLTSSLACR